MIIAIDGPAALPMVPNATPRNGVKTATPA
jgi:hypothetical protein